MIKREEFTFDSRDQKSKIYAMKWLPETDQPICVVQIIHGMAEYIERYDDFARFLARHGIVVVGEDHLGHGRTATEQGQELGYFCKLDPATVVVRDNHRLKKIIQEQYLGVPYIILGHSMGSLILRNYLMRYGKGIDGAIIMSTAEPNFGMSKFAVMLSKVLGLVQKGTHKSGFLNAAVFGKNNRRISSPRTFYDWMSSDTDIVDKYMEDKLCGFTFTLNGFQTLFQLTKNATDPKGLSQLPLKLPILILGGEEDPVGGYGMAPKNLYDSYLNLDMTKVQMKLYKDARHELINEVIRDRVYKDLLSFIQTVANS